MFAVDFGRQQPIMMPKNENAFELTEQTAPNMMVELWTLKKRVVESNPLELKRLTRLR